MKLYQCANCTHMLFFENTSCEKCGAALGFNADDLSLQALTAEGEYYRFVDQNHPQNQTLWQYCENHQHDTCNWLVRSDSDTTFCLACALNRYVPALSDVQDHEGWRALEFAKHRLVYSLLQLKLPVQNKLEHPSGIAFDVINKGAPVPEDAATTIGHDQGKITVPLDETDPVQREQTRINMKEHYRTLLGHLRHEIGHYYWDLLIADNEQRLADCRAYFGDETQDYSEALTRHYHQGPPADWRQRFISAYASSHPWEDWAETWAHYFHIMDVLDTANSFGLSLSPQVPNGEGVMFTLNPYEQADFNVLLESAITLSVAVNSLNRSMGQPDFYPFVLTESSKGKLAYIHSLLQSLR